MPINAHPGYIKAEQEYHTAETKEQKINALIDEDASLQPISVYCGLAYDFDGVYFDSGDDEMEEEELQEYEPLGNETEERYFEYFLIKNGKPELLEI